MTDTITRETCDRCGPGVAAAVTTQEGLTFCAHCARKTQLRVVTWHSPVDHEGFVIVPDSRDEQDTTPTHSRPATADPDFDVSGL